MKDPLQPTGPILQSPPRAEAQRFTYSSGDRPLAGYTIKRGIGRGGFGEVYYGTSDGGKEVALKLVQRNLEVELRGVGHCLNLKHGNLVGLYDVKQADNGDYWVVMEYVAGECLIDVIDRHPLGVPLVEALQWMQGICGAVAYLHDRGIVHRDLKPANLFMEDGIVKVGDYGLSKFITHSRRSGQTESVGTVHYMAPEIANGRYGKEIDIYATGVILYEMLTGQVPFEGESVGEVLMKHLTAKPELAAVPEPFRPIVGRALAKDPSQRYASIDRMVEDIEDVAGDAWSAVPVARAARPDGAAPHGPLDLGNADLVSASPARPAPVPPPPPGGGHWASFLREDPVVCWVRRKWQGLSPNNPWHVIGFALLAPLLLLGVFWGILPLAAGCYVAAAMMVRWLKGPSPQAVASPIERGGVMQPRPPAAATEAPALSAGAPVAAVSAPPYPNAPARRRIPSGLFVIMALFLGAGLGLLTGGIVAAMRFDEETAAFLGMSSGFFVFAIALFCWFPHSRWWRALVALLVATCVGMAAGALGLSMWRGFEAALLGVGTGLLSGGLLLSRALRGVGWWRAVASPLIAAGVGMLVGWMAVLSDFDEEVGAMLGVGCGLLVCAVSGYRLATDRPARATHAVRPRSRGHRIQWTVTFVVVVLLLMAMMLIPTVTDHRAGSTIVRTWSGITRSHTGAHGPACADIEMIIRTYPFPNDRARELARIAQRNGLGADEQIHLIDATLDEVAYPNEQVRVLLPLASSPELTPEARFHLSTKIDRISFRSERERLFRALMQNPQTDASQEVGHSTTEESEAEANSRDGNANGQSTDDVSAAETQQADNE